MSGGGSGSGSGVDQGQAHNGRSYETNGTMSTQFILNNFKRTEEKPNTVSS